MDRFLNLKNLSMHIIHHAYNRSCFKSLCCYHDIIRGGRICLNQETIRNGDDHLEVLHLDWITARPCIARTLTPTINTEVNLVIRMTLWHTHICTHTYSTCMHTQTHTQTHLLAMIVTTCYYYGLLVPGVPSLAVDCHWLDTSGFHRGRPKKCLHLVDCKLLSPLLPPLPDHQVPHLCLQARPQALYWEPGQPSISFTWNRGD